MLSFSNFFPRFMALYCIVFFLSACALKLSKPNAAAALRDESPFARAEFSTLNEDSVLTYYSDEEEEEDDDDENIIPAESEKAVETLQEGEMVVVSESRSQAEVTADDEAGKSFPLVTNEFVESWIKYFTGRGRPVMERWLARSTRYIPMMKQVLREKGLPEDLIYLSMIESGFNLKAKSRAKAVGPWQFIKSTGQRYGLKVEYWVDERRDYRKSTYAAAKYLGELHDVFGSWYLAAAAYNAGEGKVLSAVRRDRTRNFWELARRKKRNFRAETRNYVPKIIAAALVSKNPEKYGFKQISYENPLTWESVNVPSGVSLKQVATLLKTDELTLGILNAELRREITPPGNAGYALRVPPQKKQILVDNLANLESKRIGNFMEYTIKKGDTLSTIARRFGTDIEALRELNKLSRRSLLRIGRDLIVPVGGGRRYAAQKRHQPPKNTSSISSSNLESRKQKISSSNSFTSGATATLASANAIGSQHVIQEGESFWSIAKKYGLSVRELRDANKGKGSRSLRPGQILSLPGSVNGG